jgi:type II secretory pathway pseudopilin PulG
MYCAKCGQENPAEGTTCSSCGQPLRMPAQPPAAAGPAVPAGEAQTAGKATASLVLGLFSLVICVAGIPAVILGHMALSEIKKSAGRLKGEGMALAGLIMGYLTVVALPVILIIAAIAIPNLLRSRVAANEASAVGSLRTINVAAVTYATTYPKAGFPGSLEAMGGAAPCTPSSTTACLIDPMLALGLKSGYGFTYAAEDADGDGVIEAYTVEAVPVSPGNSGNRSFCSDESGVIRATTSEPCTRESQPLQ